MSTLVEKIDKHIYPDYENHWDIRLFREKIIECLTTKSIVLDLGAGASVTGMNLRGKAGRICGIDLDKRIEQNSFLDEAKIASAESIPYADNTFDIAICLHVLEHLKEPAIVFREVNRVLKPGGIFLIRTPNKFHYVPFMGRITPDCFHKTYNKIRGRCEEDTFPTFYRANSRSSIKRLAKKTNFAVEKIELIEGRPEYLRIAWPTYMLGLLYEKIVNSSELFSNLRSVLIARMRKPI